MEQLQPVALTRWYQENVGGKMNALSSLNLNSEGSLQQAGPVEPPSGHQLQTVTKGQLQLIYWMSPQKEQGA